MDTEREKVASKAQDCIKVTITNEGTFSLRKGENVLSVLKEGGFFDTSHCGGHGTCGKCAVRFVKAAPLPLPADRRRFTPDRLREGWRLACLAKPLQDCELEIGFEKEEITVIKSCVWGLEEAEDTGIGRPGEQVILGDIGTTTIALLVWDKGQKKVIDSYAGLNPQRKYGADVVSRMEAAMAEEKDAVMLSESVKSFLSEGIRGCREKGMMPEYMILTGNTVMTHLLMEYPVDSLAVFPFAPAISGEIRTEIAGLKTVILPEIEAFVGGDITAGILLVKKQMEAENLKFAFLLDLGTNGEMALLGTEEVWVTATAAGPAFEGGIAGGIYGADVISMVAKLVKKQMVDETGLMAQPYFEKGIQIEEEGKQGILCQEDIRKLQLAKAAVLAGIRILSEEAGIDIGQVEKVFLAGGFGYYLSGDAACDIGVIPGKWRDRVLPVGNSALAGARLYDEGLRPKEKVNYINLAGHGRFEEYYLQAMELRSYEF